MTVCSVFSRLLAVAPFALWLAGCSPMGDTPADEEKDPHYLAGKNRLSSMDYEGAINQFESALEANPRSAAAHRELGLLYEEHMTNKYATAIYHFEKHLELEPKSNWTEPIRQHILACKLELAKTVPFALVNSQVQDELRRLYTTNAALNQEIERLKSQLIEQAAAWSNRLAEAKAAQAAQKQLQPPPSTVEYEPRHSATERQNSPAPTPPSPRVSSSPRTHVVKSGETLASIAKRYNIRLGSLQAANPGVDARRLKAGQTLVLPNGKEPRQ